MITNTASRVNEHTAPEINARIEQDWKDRLAALSSDDRTALIDRRLAELNKEWDVERLLQTNFAALSLVGIGLASKLDKRWALLALVVPAFMIQHAVQGWCPPLAVLRRLGIRTAKEINEERFALTSLRGDFDNLNNRLESDAVYESVKDQGRPEQSH
jgi:hypothetical protein